MSYGSVSKTAALPPLWVIVACACAMAPGTYPGGWRIIRTLGKGLVEIKSPQGMAAESSSAASFCCPLTSATRCPPRRSAPVRCWAAAWANPAARCAGASPAGWRRVAGHAAAGRPGRAPSPTGSCTGSADTRARSSASPCWSRSPRSSTSGRARPRSTSNNVNAEWKGDLTAGLEEDDHLGSPARPRRRRRIRSDAPTAQARKRARYERLVQLPGLPEDPGLRPARRCGLPALFAARGPGGLRRCRCPRFRWRSLPTRIRP